MLWLYKLYCAYLGSTSNIHDSPGTCGYFQTEKGFSGIHDNMQVQKSICCQVEGCFDNKTSTDWRVMRLQLTRDLEWEFPGFAPGC